VVRARAPVGCASTLPAVTLRAADRRRHGPDPGRRGDRTSRRRGDLLRRRERRKERVSTELGERRRIVARTVHRIQVRASVARETIRPRARPQPSPSSVPPVCRSCGPKERTCERSRCHPAGPGHRMDLSTPRSKRRSRRSRGSTCAPVEDSAEGRPLAAGSGTSAYSTLIPPASVTESGEDQAAAMSATSGVSLSGPYARPIAEWREAARVRRA
jgi:hypothetical protein